MTNIQDMNTFEKIKIPRVRLADKAYIQILEAITNNKIDIDKKIIQEQLATQLDISRTPVREALFRLHQEGILELSEKGGFYVRKITKAEVREIYHTRIAIEGYSIRLLTNRKDKLAMAKIESTIKIEENKSLSTPAELYHSNRNIHRAFVENTNNKYLLEMFDQMWNRSICFFIFQTMPKQELRAKHDDHYNLCKLMQLGDEDNAEKAMREHIVDGMNLQLENMETL